MKQSLRGEYLALRKALLPAHRAEKSREICNGLLHLPALAYCKEIACYEAFPSEVDIRRFIEGSRAKIHILSQKPDELTTRDFDAWIVPGIVFDKLGHRIGFGKGTYDRLLEKSAGLKIGVCFYCQISPTPLPRASHDVRMDILVTEEQVYSFL